MGTTERVITAEEHTAFDSAYETGKGRQVGHPADMSPAARAALELIELPTVSESGPTTDGP